MRGLNLRGNNLTGKNWVWSHRKSFARTQFSVCPVHGVTCCQNQKTMLEHLVVIMGYSWLFFTLSAKFNVEQVLDSPVVFGKYLFGKCNNL